MPTAWLPKKGLGPISPASSDVYVQFGSGMVIENEASATEVMKLNSQPAALATLAMTGLAASSNTIDGMFLISDGTNSVWVPTMSTIVS